jgi:hypothetical protein
VAVLKLTADLAPATKLVCSRKRDTSKPETLVDALGMVVVAI